MSSGHEEFEDECRGENALACSLREGISLRDVGERVNGVGKFINDARSAFRFDLQMPNMDLDPDSSGERPKFVVQVDFFV